MSLKHPYGRDNGVNKFDDYDTLCLITFQNNIDDEYCLCHNGERRKFPLTRAQFLECCVNLFYQNSKDGAIGE